MEAIALNGTMRIKRNAPHEGLNRLDFKAMSRTAIFLSAIASPLFRPSILWLRDTPLLRTKKYGTSVDVALLEFAE